MKKPFKQFVAEHGIEHLTTSEQQELYAQYCESVDHAMDMLCEDQEAYGASNS